MTLYVGADDICIRGTVFRLGHFVKRQIPNATSPHIQYNKYMFVHTVYLVLFLGVFSSFDLLLYPFSIASS